MHTMVNLSEAWLKIAITDMDKVPCEFEVESLAGQCVANITIFTCGDVLLSAVVDFDRKNETTGHTPLSMNHSVHIRGGYLNPKSI